MKAKKLNEVLCVLVINEEALNNCKNPSEYIPTGWEVLDEEQLDLFDSHMDLLMQKTFNNAA